MQPGNEQVWMQGSSSWMPSGPGFDHMGDKMDTLDADGTLHAFINDSVHSVDVPLQNPNFQDHEMFSWLHFPIDDAIEKAFCTDFFRDLPSSNVQIVKHSFNQLGLQQEVSPLNTTEALLNDLLPPNPGSSSLSICPSISQGTVEVVDSCSSCPIETRNMVAGADAAMVVNGGRATVVNTSHYGVEPLQAPAQLSLPIGAVLPVMKLKNLDMVPLLIPNPSLVDLSQRHFPSSSQGSALLPVLKPPDVSFCTTQPSLQRNFAHFSSPVAETRASLHAVNASSGPTNIERARQSYGQTRKVDCNDIKQPSQREVASMEIDTRHATLPLQPLPVASLSVCVGETSRGKSMREDNLVSSHLSNSAITASNRAMEKLHITEQTATSPSRGSASSSEKSGREAATALKRRFSGADDSECQSEDLEETTNNSKKSVKRSRAAEMHNLCERKRRDRINEKLLALRDLMPNSSKTAKASILDEAIEYVKLLQSQLQTWSARTGICIPPTLIPSIGMQHLQMPGLPHMGLGMGVGMGVGLGMGMGMGMGMGLMDVNAAAVAAGRTMMPLPPYPGQPSTGLQPCLPAMRMVDGQEHLQNHHILDPYNIYVPHQQAQPSPMNLAMYRNMELYNAYMQGQQQQQHQWQLQQQHQWQLLQQQQSQGNNASKLTQ